MDATVTSYPALENIKYGATSSSALRRKRRKRRDVTILTLLVATPQATDEDEAYNGFRSNAAFTGTHGIDISPYASFVAGVRVGSLAGGDYDSFFGSHDDDVARAEV